MISHLRYSKNHPPVAATANAVWQKFAKEEAKQQLPYDISTVHGTVHPRTNVEPHLLNHSKREGASNCQRINEAFS
jgi:hypothetical protein